MEEPAQLVQFLLCLFLFNWSSFSSANEIDDYNDKPEFKIEGKVYISSKDKEWTLNSRVLVDGGEYLGFVRTDGSFVVHGVPSGSYIVEIANPNALFEPLRVDITSKGKIRARRVNFLQPTLVKTVNYPLEFRERGQPNYFQKREQLRLTDFLFNPMVLTMIVPLLLIMVLPKLMNAADADTQKEALMGKYCYPKENAFTIKNPCNEEKLDCVVPLQNSATLLLTDSRKVSNLSKVDQSQKKPCPSKKMLSIQDFGWKSFKSIETIKQNGNIDSFLFPTKSSKPVPERLSVKSSPKYMNVISAGTQFECVNSQHLSLPVSSSRAYFDISEDCTAASSHLEKLNSAGESESFLEDEASKDLKLTLPNTSEVLPGPSLGQHSTCSNTVRNKTVATKYKGGTQCSESQLSPEKHIPFFDIQHVKLIAANLSPHLESRAQSNNTIADKSPTNEDLTESKVLDDTSWAVSTEQTFLTINAVEMQGSTGDTTNIENSDLNSAL